MTHEKILQPATSSANQHCVDIDKKRSIIIKRCDGIGETISYLQAPSIPLCARSRIDWKTGPSPGCENCLYGETIQESDQSTSKICKDQRPELERDRDSSARGLFAKRSEAWLKGENALGRSSWNTAMTDCQLKRSYRLIGSWFLKKSGIRFMNIIV
jgi:hypothetical protein